MSVEEARERVWQRFEQYAIWTADECNEAINRLILEVQADLPCYLTHGAPLPSCGERPADWIEALHGGWPLGELRPCPSCTARNKLASMAVPAP